jgi:hypothetical protein
MNGIDIIAGDRPASKDSPGRPMMSAIEKLNDGLDQFYQKRQGKLTAQVAEYAENFNNSALR